MVTFTRPRLADSVMLSICCFAGLPDFTPYDPFAPESNDGPHQSLADHHSQTPFQHALPDAPFHPPLHHTAPADFAAPDFAPSPEPAVEESLPFPCFRYEEELAAALLQNGAVHNVEHLLTVAPGCTMPPEVLDCFQGRWPGMDLFISGCSHPHCQPIGIACWCS